MATIPTATKDLVRQLHDRRFAFEREATAFKLQALRRLADRAIRSPSLLKTLHRTLCYLLAYPDSVATFRAADALLRSFGERVRVLSPAGRKALADSGIAGTDVRLDFSYDVAEWLFEAYADAVEIDWEAYESPEDLDSILTESIVRAEVQTFDDGEVSTEDWVRQAKGPLPVTDFAWVWRHMVRHIPARSVRESLYEKAAVPLVWRLCDSGIAPSAPRAAVKRPFCHRPGAGILRFAGDARREIMKLLPAIRPVGKRRGLELIRFTVATLAARHREVYGDCRGNPEEVYEVPLGRGAVLILIGVRPEHRLNLEGNYGSLLVKNGMPVGYGGVSPLFDQANTGINIFEEYRRGEAAYLFVQTLRAFHALFGSRRFIVNPYQTGGDNREAILSGAFWFYYRLGFRPVDEDVRREAEREAARLSRGRGTRTDTALLRRLAASDLELVLPGAAAEGRFEERWLGVLAGGVTDCMAAQGCADRSRAAARIVSRVAGDLGAGRARRWLVAERRAFEDMAPLAALIEDLAAWPPSDKRALVRLMRAKGGKRERDYLAALRRHDGLRNALATYCRRREAT